MYQIYLKIMLEFISQLLTFIQWFPKWHHNSLNLKHSRQLAFFWIRAEYTKTKYYFIIANLLIQCIKYIFILFWNRLLMKVENIGNWDFL